jgi:hypothetical protein
LTQNNNKENCNVRARTGITPAITRVGEVP